MIKKVIAIGVIALALPLAALAGSQQITSVQARSLLAKKPAPFLLDVRTEKEYREEHLHGAVLIPIMSLPQRIAEVPRNRDVLVYCAVGGRSRVAAALLAAKGYPRVYDMTDGIAGWTKKGFPVEK